MSDTIIVKKVIKKGGGHGSTSWKIALADFMTALMIVFFVLWVTASTDETVASGISNHFTGKATITMDGEVKEIDQIKEMFDDLREMINEDMELTYDEKNDVIKAEMKSDSLFDTGSFIIANEAKVSLRQFAETIGKSELYLHVYGYADNTPIMKGREISSNLELSTYRSLSVSSYLMANGISQERMTIHGEGELNPIALNTSMEGKEKNRRVEIYISLTPHPARSYVPLELLQETDDGA